MPVATWVQVRIAAILVAGLAGCSPCDLETIELGGCRTCAHGDVRHGVLVAPDWNLSVASGAGTITHASCDGSIRVLDSTFVARDELDPDYKLDGAKSVVDLAAHEDGTIAAIVSEEQFESNDDLTAAKWLVVFDDDGRRLWKSLLSTDFSDTWRGVAIGPELVFVRGAELERVFAYARATGEAAWSAAVLGPSTPSIAALGDGGVLVVPSATGADLIAIAGDGSERWRKTPMDLGVEELGVVAVAPNGSIAIVGSSASDIAISQYTAVMLEPDGALRWSRLVPPQTVVGVTSIVTDGVHIVMGGAVWVESQHDGLVVDVTADTFTELARASGPGTQYAYSDAITPDGVIVHVTSTGSTSDDPTARFTISDVRAEGAGTAILEIVR